MNERRICVVTGSRAEYGLLRNLMRGLQARSDVRLQVLATGMHLVPECGMTIEEIRSDGFTIDECVESQLASDSTTGTAKSLGLGIIGCTDALRRLQPHIVVLLGDRYEILGAAMSASLLGIPVAHVSGGEVTEGAIDEWIRHAITKASWWHFVATYAYRDRVIQLGEAPDRVFAVGDPALDSINELPVLERSTLEESIGLSLVAPIFLVTYHPATLGDKRPEEALSELLAALDDFPQATVVMTRPNADAGGHLLTELIEAWVARNAHRARCVASLGQVRYLSLMRLADAVIGNSSSGIVEAPALRVATVNVGPRQDGRLRASSIVDCPESRQDIAAAIRQVLAPEFSAALPQTISLYGESGASARMTEWLATEPLPDTLRKRFHDV
jgi:UDP-hydrolysing UDP-N-acetyl-D-glucosamine 2-epimerase